MNELKRILITGASGLIGSHLAFALAQEGHTLFLLIRGSKNQLPLERWNKTADWFGLSRTVRERISVFSGDLEASDLNLDSESSNFLKSNVDEIVHAAASTSFSEKKREEAIRVNVQGTQHLLSFVEGSACQRIHAISTAYVAGRSSQPCFENFSDPSGFLNPYEETKHHAELLLRDFCRHKKLRLMIYRPSVVYGNSETGRTFRFNALYHPVRSVAYLAELFRKDLLENGGKQAHRLGVSFGVEKDAGRALNLPLCFDRKQGTGINLIPINYCVESILKLMKTNGAESIFHVVNEQNTSLESLINYTGRFLNVTGLTAQSAEGARQRKVEGLDRLLQRTMEVYQPYIEDIRVFDQRKAKEVLLPAGIRCPTFSYPLFERCMRYAQEVNWGKAPKNEDSLLAG